MTAWLPGRGLDLWWQWWIAPVLSMTAWWVVSCCRVKSDTQMTSDILEFVDVSDIKQSARNIWVNVAVVNALVLTIIIAMLQEDPIEAKFDTDDNMVDALVAVQEFYISLLLVGFMSNVLSLMKCIVNLTYSEPLSNKDVIKYFIANPNSLGEPVCDVCIACMFSFLAMAFWVLGTYGAPNAALAFAITVYVSGYSVGYIRGKAQFTPDANDPKNEWSWALKDHKEWPTYVHSKDEQTVRVFKSLGLAATSEEKEPVTTNEGK